MVARQRQVEPTEEWAEPQLLLECPEQVEYERIRPAVAFGSPVAERSRQTGTPQMTLRRRTTSFKSEGMRGLFELSALGEVGWVKSLKLGEYAPRRARRPRGSQALQEVLFAYTDAI